MNAVIYVSIFEVAVCNATLQPIILSQIWKCNRNFSVRSNVFVKIGFSDLKVREYVTLQSSVASCFAFFPQSP